MIRYEDAWGRPCPGSEKVKIETTKDTFVEMAGGNKSKAFDSDNSKWLDSTEGALKKWNAKVMDGTLGAQHLAPPPIESLKPGGYYEVNADMVIATDTTPDTDGIVRNYALGKFDNPAEKRTEENVKILDISKIASSNYYKTNKNELEANGLKIHCKTPVFIINAEKLPCKLTITSDCNIYTKGDFNKLCAGDTANKGIASANPNFEDKFGEESRKINQKFVDKLIEMDQAGNIEDFINDKDGVRSDISTKQPAAIITCQRIYHLTEGYNLDNKGKEKQTPSENAAPAEGADYVYPGLSGDPGDNRTKWKNADLFGTVDNKGNVVKYATYEKGSFVGYKCSNKWKSLSKEAQDYIIRLGQLDETNNYLEINAALVDGPPTVDERRFVKNWKGKEKDNGKYKDNADPNNGSPTCPNSDDFLENFGSVKVKKRGSIVHMQNADMADFDNDFTKEYNKGKCPWILKSCYSAPTRDYGYDNDLASQHKQPPGFLNITKRMRWSVK